MKNAWLYVLLLMLLGLIGFGANPAGAASAAGPYYATPSWDQTMPASMRFIVLTNMNSEAVLDRETGLVWEQSPDNVPDFPDWKYASRHCNRKNTGGRLGWRVPTIQELASLVDPSVPSPGPTLPSGHPFSNVQSSLYWSATTYPDDAAWGWLLYFRDGSVLGKYDKIPAAADIYVWCVRGGQGVDAQ